MQLRSFLSVLAPVAARAPSVFVEAVRATCTLSEAGAGSLVAGRRAMITLKKKVGRALCWVGALLCAGVLVCGVAGRGCCAALTAWE